MSRPVVVGVWCGTDPKNLLQRLCDMPLLRITLKRAHTHATGAPCALVPWARELDHLAAEAKGWGCSVMRCHPAQLIAMRDLVSLERSGVGILVQGHAADIDKAELRLALARLSGGFFEEYLSPRITAYPLARWLKVSDTDEWPKALLSMEELRRLYTPTTLDEGTRELRGKG